MGNLLESCDIELAIALTAYHMTQTDTCNFERLPHKNNAIYSYSTECGNRPLLLGEEAETSLILFCPYCGQRITINQKENTNEV